MLRQPRRALVEEFLRTEQLKSSPLFQNRRCLNNIQTKQNKTKNLTRIFKQRFIVVSSQAHSSSSQPRWPPRCQSLCGWLSVRPLSGPQPARRPLSTRPRAAPVPAPGRPELPEPGSEREHPCGDAAAAPHRHSRRKGLQGNPKCDTSSPPSQHLQRQ